MQFADPAMIWTDWLDANNDRDEATKLAALREYIVQTARSKVHSCTYDAAWANKKFAKLGITERIEQENSYTLTVAVTGKIELLVYGRNRAEALEKAGQRLDGQGSGHIGGVTATADPVFVSGPEDAQAAADDDAPQTVAATLVTLREIILLGHIAGPKICQQEADEVLRSFGLATIPERKTFTVTQPVEAVMSTTVEAYDEVSAQRVASWRWANEQSGFKIADPTPTDVVSVSMAAN